MPPTPPIDDPRAVEASGQADPSYDEHILRQLARTPDERLAVMLAHARAMQRLRASALAPEPRE